MTRLQYIHDDVLYSPSVGHRASIFSEAQARLNPPRFINERVQESHTQ